ncbi:MAG: hypothetical protein ACKVHO_01975 [Verrucomicrobiia bacterium]|jgi:hypothetical protein
MKRALSSLFLSASLTFSFAATKADYIVHEWGPFTSLQGADGEQQQLSQAALATPGAFVFRR